MCGMCSLRPKVSSLGDGLGGPHVASPMQSLRCPASPGFKLPKYPCQFACPATPPGHRIGSRIQARVTDASIRTGVSQVCSRVRLRLQARRGGEPASASRPSSRPGIGGLSRLSKHRVPSTRTDASGGSEPAEFAVTTGLREWIGTPTANGRPQPPSGNAPSGGKPH